MHGYEVNVIGTQEVLSYCRRVGARCVLASTSAVYLAPADGAPLTESAALRPASPYAMSKWLAERLCEHAVRVRELVAVAERVFGGAAHVEMAEQHPGEIAAAVADTTRAQRELGWSSQYDLAAGLRAMQTAMVR
jgi:nucleoside-diphosphate-sugar epimerase